MKRLLIIIAMIFSGVCAFGLEDMENRSTDNQPVITGGWHEIDISELDEAVKHYVMGYLEGYIPHAYASYKVTGWIVDRVWSQLVQGRRYLAAYYIIFEETTENEYSVNELPPMLGLLTLKRTPDGIISLEKEYSHMALFDFIELMLTGEIKKKKLPKTSIVGSLTCR
jgi:hypothetical protein